MKVTKDGNKDRQLNKGYLQKVFAEQKEYAEASARGRITESNHIITNLQEGSLLERIIDRDNLNQAYKKVKANKGVGGTDRMSVDELLPYLKENNRQLVQKIKDGKYKSDNIIAVVN